MNKHLLSFVILILGAMIFSSSRSVESFSTISSGADSVKKSEKPNADIGAKLIDFTVVTNEDILMFKDQLVKKNKPFVLILFNPACGHCTDAIEHFVAAKEKFEGIPIVFITGSNLYGEIKKCALDTKSAEMKSMVIAADNSEVTKQLFEYKGIPQLMIYDKHQILQSKYYIDIPVNSVDSTLKALQKKSN
ncbi:MAG TPA: redoxin domain-containing protein [Chitinophagaceae bacterium]|nr:redoxin domain-containing protein [Chitinophagaceae bacterium]